MARQNATEGPISPKKGRDRAPNGGNGRPKGAVNRVTADVKSMVMTALDHAGGAEYLFMQAYDNPKSFMALVARIIPSEVKAQVEGKIDIGQLLLQVNREGPPK